MTNDEARELTRSGGAARIALSYIAFTGMLAVAVLLMKMVIALQLLGSVAAADF